MTTATADTIAPVADQPTLPIAHLQEFPDNPRRHWGDLEGLAESIRQNGIIQPLVVRVTDDFRYQVIAGARRFRAAKIAGLDQVPVTVRQASDAVALELAILENLQRHDVHPMDEALGIDRLMSSDPAYTPAAVAARLGKPERHVRERLKLLNLIDEVREAFNKEEITAGHALVLARLDPKNQKAGLEECFGSLYRGAESGESERVLLPVHDLVLRVERSVVLDLTSHETADLFPEVAAATTATPAADVLRLSSQWQGAAAKKGQPRVLGSAEYRKAKASDACAKTGVVVIGYGRGQVLSVCTDQTCAKHYPEKAARQAPASTSSTETDAEREKAAAARKREEARQLRERERRDRRDLVAVRAIAQAAKAAPTMVSAVLRLVWNDLLDYADLPGDVYRAAFTDVTRIPINRNGGIEGSAKAWTDEQVLKAVTFLTLTQSAWEDRRFGVALAPFKVDLKKIDAAVVAEQKAAAKAAKKPAAKGATKKAAAKKTAARGKKR